MGGVASALCRGAAGHTIDAGHLAMKTARQAVAIVVSAKLVKLCDQPQAVQEHDHDQQHAGRVCR